MFHILSRFCTVPHTLRIFLVSLYFQICHAFPHHLQIFAPCPVHFVMRLSNIRIFIYFLHISTRFLRICCIMFPSLHVPDLIGTPCFALARHVVGVGGLYLIHTTASSFSPISSARFGNGLRRQHHRSLGPRSLRRKQQGMHYILHHHVLQRVRCAGGCNHRQLVLKDIVCLAFRVVHPAALVPRPSQGSGYFVFA